MRTIQTAAVVVMLGVLCVARNAGAHHSFAAQYDAKKPMTVTGTVTKFMWTNPHGHIFLEVKGADGKVVMWEVETASPGGLYRQGWRQTDLPVGAEATIEGFLARDGTRTMNAATIRLADGRRLFAGSAGTGAPSPK